MVQDVMYSIDEAVRAVFSTILIQVMTLQRDSFLCVLYLPPLEIIDEEHLCPYLQQKC